MKQMKQWKLRPWKLQWKLKPYLFFILAIFSVSFLLLIVLVIYLSTSFFFTKHVSQTRMDMLFKHQQQLNERVAQIEETALSISTNRNLIQVLSTSSIPRAQQTRRDIYESITTRRDLNLWLDNFTYIKPYIKDIHIYTDRFVNDIPLATYQRILPLSEIPWKEEIPYFNVDAIWIPSYRAYTSESEDVPVLTYVMKIFYSNKFLGYVSITWEENSLANYLLNADDDVYQMFAVLAPDGRLMSVVSNASESMSDITRDFILSVDELENEAGYKSLKMDGSEFLMIFTNKRKTQWILVEFITAENVYRDINRIRNMMFLIGIVMMVLAFLISTYLSGRITKPIPSLLRGFQKIESGQFDTRLEEHSIVEFNRLYNSFNQMGVRLKELMEELEKEHKQKQDLELRMLQSQINPHFLYNTLDMINWMAAVKGNFEVSQMAARLARLFRISVSKGNTFITLREELDHARAYAQIQEVRFEDQFKYVEKVDPQFIPCYVPKIIIQPFIENAIVHGFDPSGDQPIEVVVSARFVDQDTFELIIEDNGKGLSDEKKEREKKERTPFVSGTGGYGIQNVNARIQTYLGSKYGVVLEERETGGVKVVITLPFIATLGQLEHYRTDT